MLRYLKIAKWRANKQFKQQQKSWQPHQVKLLSHIKSIWFNLNTAQKLYLLAFITLAIFKLTWLCATITIIALIIEFWPKFNQLWNSLAGKALILVFYASIANFVLASASGIVNEVTQVSANHFNYTHNFATLLYLPPWTLGITLATLLGLQLILPFYIIVLLLIKPFGSDRIKFISQSYSPLLTALTRFFLATVVFVSLIAFIDEKPPEKVLNDIVNSFENSQSLANKSPAEQEQAIEKLSEQIEKKLPSSDNDGAQTKTFGIRLEGEDENTQTVRQFLDTKGYFERSKRLIAMFAYSYEADSYSRCKKSTESKSIELNDYEIIEITPDQSMPYGYQFTVRACESAGISATKH